MKKPSLNANLIKKYHQDIIYNYAEYPTCDHWSYDFNSEDYKKFIKTRLPRALMGTRQPPIMEECFEHKNRSIGNASSTLPINAGEGKIYQI